MNKLKKYLVGVLLIVIGIIAGITADHYLVYNVREWTEYEIDVTRNPFILIVYKINGSEREQIMIADDIADALNYTCKEEYSRTTVKFGIYRQYTPFKVSNYVTVKFNDGVLVMLYCKTDIITDKYSFYVLIEGLKYMRILEGGQFV